MIKPRQGNIRTGLAGLLKNGPVTFRPVTFRCLPLYSRKARPSLFFILSKIVWALLSPLNLVFLLTAGGFLCRRWRGIFSGAALAVFVLFGILPTGHNMLVLLERQYSRPDALPAWINVIFVAGGSFETSISSARNVPVLNDNVERILDATVLARRYPNAALVFSGGNGSLAASLARQGIRTEAEDAALFLKETGFRDDNVLYEDESRTTYENVIFTRNLFTPLPEETWIAVTSAYHMPRLMAVMKTVRWPGVIVPWPTDYRTDGVLYWLPRDFNIIGHMYDSHVALHEYLGLLSYQMSGKISFPL